MALYAAQALLSIINNNVNSEKEKVIPEEVEMQILDSIFSKIHQMLENKQSEADKLLTSLIRTIEIVGEQLVFNKLTLYGLTYQCFMMDISETSKKLLCAVFSVLSTFSNSLSDFSDEIEQTLLMLFNSASPTEDRIQMWNQLQYEEDYDDCSLGDLIAETVSSAASGLGRKFMFPLIMRFIDEVEVAPSNLNQVLSAIVVFQAAVSGMSDVVKQNDCERFLPFIIQCTQCPVDIVQARMWCCFADMCFELSPKLQKYHKQLIPMILVGCQHANVKVMNVA